MATANDVRDITRQRWLRWLVVAIAGAALASACATGEVIVEGDDDAQQVGVGGGGGSVGVGGAGGEGGAVEEWPCGIDCASINTPTCKVATCDMAIKQCVVGSDVDGTECDDQLFCTTGDSCQAGVCTGAAPNTCGVEPEACQEVVCNEDSQTCSETPLVNDTPCTAADLCLQNTKCTNGLCLGEENDCFFAPLPGPCHVATCNPATGTCVPQPGNFNLDCDDVNDPCTWGKTCNTSGSCVGGAPADCSPLTVGCFNGACDMVSGQCVAQPIAVGGACNAAADDCNVGSCDMNGTCQPVPANEAGSCEDGNPCTVNETCTLGTCGGGQAVPQIVFFSEDFADNTAGWTLDTEWQIGPAISSVSPGSCGNGDPGTDNTPTMDNGIGGVVIGGNAGTSIHAPYWLTSPPVDTSVATGSLWLGFHRWLNSDYTPFMKNLVQVFDGTAWVTVWESGPSPGIQDGVWGQQVIDVGAYKNTAMQVRFGFEILQGGVFTCSQWNVDDVVLANVVCPI